MNATEEAAAQITGILAPIKSHDSLSFEDLCDGYNFGNVSDRRRPFVNAVVQSVEGLESPIILDVGCGRGIAREHGWQEAIKQYAGLYWGIEPDRGSVPPAGLFDHVYFSKMEEAELPPESVDVAYSWMVMEHVNDPLAFCESLYASLKPGGSYYFATPNSRHYFTRTAKICNRLGIDDWVLKKIRRSQEVQDYHYPVFYRFNDESSVREVAQSIGFNAPEFAYVEVQGAKPYFPSFARPIYHLLAKKRVYFRQRRSLMVMFGRLTKAV